MTINRVHYLLDASLDDCQIVDQKSAQLELFRDNSGGIRQVTFIDVDLINQQNLLDIIAMNPVSEILDIRPKPVFRKPSYDHSQVSSYIYNKKISYRECTLYMSGPNREITFEAVVPVILKEGVTICLFDSEAQSIGWLGLVRSMARRKDIFDMELNPRSLLGYPRPTS